MKTLLQICLLMLVFFGSKDMAVYAETPPLNVKIDSGEIQGFLHEDRARAWLGVPYAAPPIGELRWRPPTLPLPWQAPRSAAEYGAQCAQPSWGQGDMKFAGSEDCLTLNIFAPKTSVDKPMPTMLWIHGGANYLGRSNDYDGSYLASVHKVIVVTVNYRLGPFGWFHHPAITQANQPATGQFALLDMIAALQWVQRNIKAFGGNPKNVTIFG
ncbi:MAG: carboxylesterase family protein, partial [Pseudomonadota bacterium]